ncbi:MAG TPA: GyrI-like domain-containing protein [Jiangellales bacterium]|nr:GyrI-like domain-containing protein [Jiangellales bacterium]
MKATQEVTSRQLTETYTAVVRGEMPVDELPAWLAGVFPTVANYLRETGVIAIGPPFARFAFLGRVAAVEAGFPVPTEITGDGLVEPSTLPGGPAAVTMHVGSYQDLDKVYLAVRSWVSQHGYVTTGPHWEVYLTDPTVEPDPTCWRTDVVLPYRPA